MSASLEVAVEAPPADGAPSAPALLFSPDRAMERQARVGRALWFLLAAWICALLLATALALRVDAHGSTLRKLEMSGQLQGMSDRQIADETRNAERLFEVATIAKGVTGVPALLGMDCLAILGLCWFFRGRVVGRAVAPVAAATLLPGAIADLVDAATVFRHAMVPPEGVPLAPRTLSAVLPLLGHPLGPPWIKLGNALDFYSLWAAVIMGFGVAAAGQVSRRNALIGTLTAWVCYRLLTQVAVGG